MTHIGKSPVLAFVVGLLCYIAQGQNITASTCANPGVFRTCMGTVELFLNDCIAKSVPCDVDCIQACACAAQVGQIGCALESCWNVVYGCEYQSIAAELVSYCFASAKDIPFFPAPDNAPGGCSCNLGYISSNLTNVANAVEPCDAHSTGNVARTEACLCCQKAGELTSIYSIYPDVSLSYLENLFTAGSLGVVEFGFSSCPSSFSQFDCVRDLGYPQIAAFSYLTTIPTTSGTLTPSTTGGSITSPLSSKIVYTIGSTMGTITPVAATTNNQPASSQRTTSSAVGSTSTGSAPRIASASASFFNSQMLIICSLVFFCWM